MYSTLQTVVPSGLAYVSRGCVVHMLRVVLYNRYDHVYTILYTTIYYSVHDSNEHSVGALRAIHKIINVRNNISITLYSKLVIFGIFFKYWLSI